MGGGTEGRQGVQGRGMRCCCAAAALLPPAPGALILPAPACPTHNRVAGLYVVERLKGEVLAGVAAEHQRLMAAKARRRAIAKAAAAGGGHPAAAAPSGGGGSSEGRPGRVRFDLPPEAAQPSSGGSGWSGAATRVPLTDAEALQQLDRHRLWHSSQAFARGVLSELRLVACGGKDVSGGS